MWRQLDPELWEMTHNPWVVLQTVSRDRIEQVLADPVFRKNVDGLVRSQPTVGGSASVVSAESFADAPLTCVAYFSMEFMLSEALPIYSGGLGNVAGDQLKAASDLGVPVVAVGLLYQQGYFRQVIGKRRRAASSLPLQRSRTVADHAIAPPERRMAAIGDRFAWLLGLAARLAGAGRPSETVPAG